MSVSRFGSGPGNFHNYADDLSNCLIHIYIAVNLIETQKSSHLPFSQIRNLMSSCHRTLALLANTVIKWLKTTHKPLTKMSIISVHGSDNSNINKNKWLTELPLDLSV